MASQKRETCALPRYRVADVSFVSEEMARNNQDKESVVPEGLVHAKT